MDRRNFVSFFAKSIAGIALDEAIPFNRVWSFPAKLVFPRVEMVETVTEELILLEPDKIPAYVLSAHIYRRRN